MICFLNEKIVSPITMLYNCRAEIIIRGIVLENFSNISVHRSPLIKSVKKLTLVSDITSEQRTSGHYPESL